MARFNSPLSHFYRTLRTQSSINESGEQTMHIRPVFTLGPSNIVVLDVPTSRTLNQELNRAAQDLSCDFSSAKQNILARFYEQYRASTVQTAYVQAA